MDNLAHYRGLVVSTAALVVGKVEMEFDDIVQVLWVKVWHAVEKHDPARSEKTQDEFVFGCLQNQVIDLKRRRRHRTVGFDDLGFQSQDRLENELGLTVDQEAVYGQAEEEAMLLPNTLTLEERGLIALLTEGYRQAEAARFLGWTPAVMARTMRSVREKLADWAPSKSARVDVPLVGELARGDVIETDESVLAQHPERAGEVLVVGHP